ncbi:MAG TPA: hypothetical protein VMW47_08265 [Verrucomicrobiae bacterium]|nr:hypothetical protein [Verrucomicrobiae bacterium]
MPNRLTQVPDRPVPTLARILAPVVRGADLFMLATFSRPPTGSLRRTWVTPATIQLSLMLSGAALAAGVTMALAVGGPARLLSCVPLLTGLGAGCVAVVGVAQRRSTGS